VSARRAEGRRGELAEPARDARQRIGEQVPPAPALRSQDRRAKVATRALALRQEIIRKSRRSDEGASCLVLRMRTRVLKQKFVALLLAAGAAASVRGTAGKQAAGRLQPFNQRWGRSTGDRCVLVAWFYRWSRSQRRGHRTTTHDHLHYMYNVRRCTAHSCDSSNGTPSRRAPWCCASDIPVPATAARGLAEAGSVARLLSLALLAPGGFCMSSCCCYREDESQCVLSTSWQGPRTVGEAAAL
jgi:hypothetical protein